MVEIPVEKKSSHAWLWILLAVVLLGLLLWWLLSGDDEVENLEQDTVAAAGPIAGEPVGSLDPLLNGSAVELAGREVRLLGVPVLDMRNGEALLVGAEAGNALLVIPEGATVPEGANAGTRIDLVGTARPLNALGENRPTLATNVRNEVYVAASAITMAGNGAASPGAATTPAAAATPPSAASIEELNQRALQRLRANPNATPRVYFAWDSAELTSGARSVLDLLIQTRTDATASGMTLVGFADRSGPRPYNRELSERRAESTRRYLASKGVSANLISVEAEGETPPLVETGDDVREPRNRRVRVELADAN